MSKATKTEFAPPGQPSWVDVVSQQVGSLRFGVVQIVVHDARVVQIERTEKTRLDQPAKDLAD
jgi:hypothetical protein